MAQFNQMHIAVADEIIPYSDLIQAAYPAPILQVKPLIGLRIGLLDPTTMNPRDRILTLEQQLPSILGGTRCLLRETPLNAAFGYYLITLPVPREQLPAVVAEAIKVIQILEQYFGIQVSKEYEINVSGRCSLVETEIKLSSWTTPAQYASCLEVQANTPYQIGRVERINPEYILIRTRWRLNPNANILMDFEDIKLLAQLLTAIY